MTKENKELLFKDLSARLPYGVKVYDTKGSFNSNYQTLVHINGPVGEAFVVSGLMCRTAPITDIKPYLFPLSSMTEEQMKEYLSTKHKITRSSGKVMYLDSPNTISYCYKNHFDYSGLIPLGLAKDATDKNIY